MRPYQLPFIYVLLLASGARERGTGKLCVFQTSRYGTILDLDGSSYLNWYGCRLLMFGITN
jgi:hypothetical protein